MDIYRQKELYRTELLKHIFNLDVAGVTNVLQMTNPYGNFEFTYGLRMLHDLFGSESRFKDCGRSKFTIEQLITHIASYTNVWCSHGDKLDALGEIAVMLWNVGVPFTDAPIISLMARGDIPLTAIQRLDTLMGGRDALKAWADHWFPNESDLDTMLNLSIVQSQLNTFLEAVVRGRFERDWDNSYREGVLEWREVFQTIVMNGVDGVEAWKLYDRLARRKHVEENVTVEDFTLERRKKRRRVS